MPLKMFNMASPPIPVARTYFWYLSLCCLPLQIFVMSVTSSCFRAWKRSSTSKIVFGRRMKIFVLKRAKVCSKISWWTNIIHLVHSGKVHVPAFHTTIRLTALYCTTLSFQCMQGNTRRKKRLAY